MIPHDRTTSSIRGIVGRLLTLAGLLLLMLHWPATGMARAQASDWELVGPGDRVVQLYTPASGAFFARTATALWRSDDGGTNWQPVSLPPTDLPNGRRQVAVDPTDQQIIFASGQGGLQRTTDGGETWTPLVRPARVGTSVRGIAISPSDHRRVFALMAESDSTAEETWVIRSDDGGTAWTTATFQSAGPSCAVSYSLFQLHPTDLDRLFRVGGCYRQTPAAETIAQSVDGGATWRDATARDLGYPTGLVGGDGAQAGRFYLTTVTRPQGSVHLFRSDDDLATWAPVLDVQDATGLVVTDDPQAPDRVFVGTSRGGVLASVDGGQTWAELGRQDLSTIYDLVLGIDGANLYAATEQGVWRHRLAAGTP